MKLLYIANINMPTPWAHGIQIMKMSEAFANAGIETELIVPRRFNKIKEDPFEYYGVESKFKIVKLPCIDLMPLGAGKFIFLLEKFSFLLSVKIYLAFKKFDIFYTREHLAGLFFKDFILETHVLPTEIKKFHIKIWQRAKKILVLTDFIKEGIMAKGIMEDKILISSDGVDLNKFNLDISSADARKKVNLPLNKKLIIYSGSFSLYSWKGVDVLLAAAQHFNSDELVVLVGGSKAEIEKIKSKIKSKNILLVGRQPYSLIPYYLKSADVLVLPNKKGDVMSEKYTSPLKLFEYMASSRPIVASALSSLQEILNNNNAILVEPNNPEGLAIGLRTVLNNKNLAEKISMQALNDVKEYTWDKRVKKIINFISK